MRKRIIIGTALLCVLLAAGMLFRHTRDIRFSQKYAISKSLTFCNSDGSIKSIDMGTSNIRFSSLTDDSLSAGTDFLSALNGTEQADVLLYSGGTCQHLFSTRQYIWGQPVIVGNCIYFIAAETNDERNGLLIKDAYLWAYQDGTIQKQTTAPVHNFSGILIAADQLLFVERGETNPDQKEEVHIVLYDTRNGEKSRLCAGKYPCWKEIGTSFFFSTPDGELAVYDLPTKSAQIVDETLELRSTPVYNAEDGVLFVSCPDPNNEKAVDLVTQGFYYLKYREFVPYRTYFQNMRFGWNEKYRYSGEAVFWT